ncbi:MAG: DUF1836 domain-containing protein [Lachnospiraceae bacterium]|nr:DUF1836 domain-containing protein [Lachnospiraceae bacterium]
MPRYHELPDMGLYLDQVTRYINQVLEPLGCQEITGSMVSNYVKKGYIASPVKKQYYAEQIAYLFFMAIAKNVLSMENISRLFEMQKRTHDARTAYDYFCQELENMLQYIFGLKETLEEVGETAGQEKKILRCAIIAMSHIIYLRYSFDAMDTAD